MDDVVPMLLLLDTGPLIHGGSFLSPEFFPSMYKIVELDQLVELTMQPYDLRVMDALHAHIVYYLHEI